MLLWFDMRANVQVNVEWLGQPINNFLGDLLDTSERSIGFEAESNYVVPYTRLVPKVSTELQGVTA